MGVGEVFSNPGDLSDVDVQTRLFGRLSTCRIPEGLAEAHLSSRDRPESFSRLIAPLYQKEAPTLNQNHTDPDNR